MQSLRPFAPLALGLTAFAFGCSDSETSPAGTGPSTGGAGGQGGVAAGTGGMAQGGNGQGGNVGGGTSYEVCANPPANYPEGPYGNEIGETFEPLSLRGFTNPNPTQRIDGEAFEDYSFDDLRADHPSTFVVLHLSAMF